MSAPTALRRAAALSAATVSLAALAVAGPQAATAGASTGCAVGMVPLTNQDTWVRAEAGFTQVLYSLPAGSGFRIVGGPLTSDGMLWFAGHGNGLTDGWVPKQNLTCT